MNETLKLLSQIATRPGTSLEDLATLYQKERMPDILASAFVGAYTMILSISTFYYGLSSEDVSSYALEKLDQALLTYVPDSASFTTYFCTLLKNKLREETQALSTHKRKANIQSNSYEEMVEHGFDIVSPPEEMLILDECFTEKEKAYCHLITDGWTNAEIANKLQVSIMTLCNMRKKLRVKLQYAL